MKIVVALLLTCCSWINKETALQNFDRAVFYNALASDNITAVNKQLEAVRNSSIPEKNAFEGTLLMKKAAIVSAPGEKLSLFKAGHKKLEASINSDKKNAEFRFLRLVIQEHAPKFLNYHDNITEDAAAVHNSFSSLEEVIQRAIKDYSKKSKALHEKDL